MLTLAAGGGALVGLARPPPDRLAARLRHAPPAGVVIVIAYTVARAIVLASVRDPEERAAAAGVWDAFLGDLRTLGWVLAGCGAVVAAAAASLIAPIEIEGPLRRGLAAGHDRAGGGPGCGVARAAALIVAGAAA